MRYRRLDDDNLLIYFSQRDIAKYHVDFSLFLDRSREKEAQDELCRLIKEADESGDFAKEGQLSIQMMPVKDDQGFVIRVKKFDIDEDEQNPEALLQQILEGLEDQSNQDKLVQEMQNVLTIVDELVQEEREEEARYYKNWEPKLCVRTQNLAELIQLSQVAGPWHMQKQALFYKEDCYILVSFYKKGIPEAWVQEDFTLMNEIVDVRLEEQLKLSDEALLALNKDEVFKKLRTFA